MKLTRLCVTVLVVLIWEFIASSSVRGASLIWTNQSGTFSGASNWSPAQAPAGNDGTQFTNDTSYTVSFTASTSQMNSNYFNGHAGEVTLDIGAGQSWTVTNQQNGSGSGGFTVGQSASSTVSVMMISGSLNVTGVTGAAFIKIGGNGQGTFTVTNGTVRNNTTMIGEAATSRGTLTISGSSTVWTNGGQTSVLDLGSISSGNTLIISNGARMFANNATIGFTTTSSTNTLVVTGTNTTLSSTVGVVGLGVGSAANTILVTGPGAAWSNSSTISFAGSGSHSLTVSNGA